MSILKPRLPEGDYWAVERVTFAGAKTMRIIWVRRRGSGDFHVAARNFRPRQYRWACAVVYLTGLHRLAGDRKAEARTIRDNERFRRAASGDDDPETARWAMARLYVLLVQSWARPVVRFVASRLR